MARDDWFRQSDWNEEIEAHFDAKLARSRDKAQYLRIQASTLAARRPDVALRLLERYFALGERLDLAQAHVDSAHAHIAQGDLQAAISSYEAALAREREFPKLLTQAYLDFPSLVATKRLSEYYAPALEVLDEFRSRLVFPVDRFVWNSAKALILADCGDNALARDYAQAALAASRESSSGFKYHQSVGLVGADHGPVIDAIKALAA